MEKFELRTFCKNKDSQLLGKNFMRFMTLLGKLRLLCYCTHQPWDWDILLHVNPGFT